MTPDISRSGSDGRVPAGSVVVDVAAELARLVERAGCVVSAAVLLNNTPDAPFDAAGYTCWADDDARQAAAHPGGVEALVPLLDAPVGSFTRSFAIDLSLILFSARAEIDLCRPCAAQIASVTDMQLDLIVQRVSPAEELYIVVFARAPAPSHHSKARATDAHRRAIVAALQQSTDALAALLALRQTYALLRSPPSK